MPRLVPSLRRLVPSLAMLWLAAAVSPWSTVACAAAEAETALDPSALVGRWRADLRPTPDAPAYYAEMIVETAADGTLTGRFYDSEIQESRINVDWGQVHFAFITYDTGGGAYNTAGRLVDGKIEGTTHAVRRGFLSVWSAEPTGQDD